MTRPVRRPASVPPRVVKAPDARRAEILTAGRALFSEQGIARTSIADVAARAGITRGLVYHYFEDKDTLVDAVLAGYVDQFVAGLREWDAAREVGNIDKALADCVALFRRYLGRGQLGTGLPRIEDAALYNRFVDQAVRALVDSLQSTTVAAYAQRHRIEIEHVPETFYVLVHGLIGLVGSNPAIDDRVLMVIVRQTLHLDAGDHPVTASSPLAAPARGRPHLVVLSNAPTDPDRDDVDRTDRTPAGPDHTEGE